MQNLIQTYKNKYNKNEDQCKILKSHFPQNFPLKGQLWGGGPRGKQVPASFLGAKAPLQPTSSEDLYVCLSVCMYVCM